MHFAKEYITKYNLAKEIIKDRIIEIEKNLDFLSAIRKIKNLKELDTFLEYEFNKRFKIIEINITFIVESLEELQVFCHEDVKNIIPKINSLKEIELDIAFSKAKDIDWLIKTIESEEDITEVEKSNLLDISEFNKKVRYFIHSTLAFAQNPLPIVVLSKINKAISEDKMLFTSKELYEDICYCLSECYRMRKAIEQFHILSNVDYGHWESYQINSDEIIKYIELYKHRFEGFYYNNHLYNIIINIENKLLKSIELNLPIIKVKEVIDILLHNAAEELVEKEIQLKKIFEKNIICVISQEEENILISIKDNGRGINEKDNIDKAFVSSKTNFKNHGIGLDVANKISKIINGSIKKQNNIDEDGATFSFKFPIFKIITLEGFKQKINILIIGEESEIEKKSKNIINEYDEVRLLKVRNVAGLKDFKKDGLIKFINILIKSKKLTTLPQHILNDFKGKIIEV